MAVANRVEALRLEQPAELRKSPMSELEAFIQMDPLLADLHKEFQDVRRNHRDLLFKNGCDDPMAQMAADMEDSAWCAMQTRLLELRNQPIKMRMAQRIQNEARREAEKQEEQDRAKVIGGFIQQVATVENRKQDRGMPGLIEWLIFYIYVLREHNLMPAFRKTAEYRMAA